MEIVFPADCGNSPRITTVSEFSARWAAADADALAEWLAEGAQWMSVGVPETASPAATRPRPPFEPDYVEILSAVSHGRFAACDGYLTLDGRRADFCHVFRFTGAAKTARIAEIRTYLVEAG